MHASAVTDDYHALKFIKPNAIAYDCETCQLLMHMTVKMSTAIAYDCENVNCY